MIISIGIYMFEAGILILFLYMLFDSDTVRIEWNSLAKFLAFMAVATVFRICISDLMVDIGRPMPIPQGLDKISLWRLALVFWEDAFFVLPIVFLRRYFSWWVCAFPAAALTYYFAIGHGYQGSEMIYIAAIYPMLISYRYGIKFGFGTVMIAHILYDFITIMTAYFISYILPWI